jgi:thiol:disulfide interchange protein
VDLTIRLTFLNFPSLFLGQFKKMRKLILLLLLFIPFFWETTAQILTPAKIQAVPVTREVKVGDIVELTFKAEIQKNWYMYTTGFDPECGPLPTVLTLEPNDAYQLTGSLVAVKDKGKHDAIFECDVRYFELSGIFSQKVKVLRAGALSIKGTYEGQACSEVTGQCVPVEGDIFFPEITVTGKSSSTDSDKSGNKTDATDSKTNVAVTPVPATPDTTAKTTPVTKADSAGQAITTSGKNTGPILDPSIVKEEKSEESFLGFFIVAFLAGLAALLTPCVFPMIPMTVSYFTAPGRTRSQAVLYGISIVVIYTIVGAALSPLMGPETANHLSTEWLPNIIFFIVFIVFGLSFLGLFDITLPGTLITSVDRQADRGGFIGVFFMAFTLVLVSFSCTGPLVGSILVSSAGGAFLKPIIGMFGFSLAFAIPFTLFAFFPEWMNTLPKSGGWLNSVKVVLGFIEIALAFKFLSIADQAFHWRILDREINLALWIVITILIGLYLMKFFLLPGDTGKDSENKRVGIPRLVLAMTFFTFAAYLIPGMWGAPLKALAGYLPPMHTHDFDLLAATRRANGAATCGEPRFSHLLHLPHGLNGYFDYDEALECARKQGKPVFIDFTGHGCTNCREMEAVVWSDPEVLKRLNDDYVVVALYVDDKTVLPENEWYTSTYDGKVKKTIGKQNADLQITNLNNNAQPFYVLVGADEKVLVSPYGYDRSVDKFVKFLDEGKKRYQERYGRN